MSKSELEKSKQGGAHRLLAGLVGEWQGTAKTWFEPDKLADKSPISGTIRAALDGRFVIHEYAGSLQGQPLNGIALMGYFLRENSFQIAWADTFHMGTEIMHSQGSAESQENSFSVLGRYGDGAGGPDWGWRTQVELADANQLTITHFNITPQGEEAKAVEIRYLRKSGT